MCYQVGVLISRSSLVCFTIEKVGILTALQFINFVFWAFIAYLGTFSLEFQFILMLWVGLLGGASYVNVVYLLLQTRKIRNEDKEVSFNILSIANDFGVLAASLLSLVLANTYYKKL